MGLDYLKKAKIDTENGIQNGVTILNTSVHDYNGLVKKSQELRDDFFDLYFKLKMKFPPGKMPFKESHIRKFRNLQELSKKHVTDELASLEGQYEFTLSGQGSGPKPAED